MLAMTSPRSVLGLLLLLTLALADRSDRQALQLEDAQNSTGRKYKCGVLASLSKACYPATFNTIVKKWGPCDVQCSPSTLGCSCPGRGSCSVAVGHPKLRSLSAGAVTAWYSVRVNLETKEWEVLDSEEAWQGDSFVKTFKWVSAVTSRKGATGLSYVDPDEVSTPVMSGGDYCQPGVAARHEAETRAAVRRI
eukprot:gb/GFBE01060680.1/.p1 GENE.gb/GFBE01060680.1/~~gb/GFBE01060680.1/.p1  ORF type:complete len:193 (+),score=26.02 gb/GFBE01060680.1/:1-579(+)